MKTLFKTLFILIGVAVIAAFACLYIVCSSERVMQNVLMSSTNKFLEGMTVRDLVIKNQVCDLPRKFTFEDVSLKLEQGEETYAMSFRAVQISEVMSLICSGKGAVLQLKDGSVKASTFRLDGLDVKIVSKSMQKWGGGVSVKEAESNGFQVRDIDAKTVITSKDAAISGINGDSYKGKVMGNAHVYFMPSVRYVADVKFEGLDTAEMEDVNLSLFSQVRGRIYGAIEVQGHAGGLENIHMNVGLNEDGEIQAKALEPLLAYIPKSIQKENIKAAIKDNRRIPVNKAQVKLADQGSETISADIQLKSDDLNLDVNVTVDIIIEGGLKSLLNYSSQISQFMKG